MSKSVARALAALTKAVAERQECIDRLVARVKSATAERWTCPKCKHLFSQEECAKSLGECSACDEFLIKARRVPMAVEADEEDQETAKAGDPDSKPGRHNPHVVDDEDESKTSATETLERENRRLAEHFPAPGAPRAAGCLDGRRLPARRRKRGPMIF